MPGYNVSLQGSITGFTKVSSAIKQYNALGAVSLKEQQAFATAVSATNSKLGTYLIGLNGSTAGLRGYGVSLVASTAKTIGLTVATTALNAAMTMGISVIVTGLISAFTAWINKSEEITEKAQEATDKINSISESLKTNTETVENAKRRYAELAQEVENLGKITQSQGTLSNEEYEEFLDLSNQLAGIFPSLTKNYDENGNAILDLSGDVNTIVSSLDDLIQKEKELANQKIMEEFPDVFKGYAQDVSDAEAKVKSAQTEFDKINNAYQQLSNGSTAQSFDLQGNGWFTNENGEKVTLSMGEYIANLEALGLKYEKTQLKVKNQFGGDTIAGYLVEATGDIDTAFTSKLETARENLQYAQQQLEGEKSSIDSYLNTWLQTEFSYNQIEDSGLQTAIQDMLFNFDFSSLPETVDKNDWNAVSEYLRRNILFAINNVQDNPEISSAISEVFTNAELTPDEKANYLQQIQDFFGEDSAIVISLKPQIEETNTLQKQLNASVDKFKSEPIDITPYQEALDDEYQKIQDWGLEDYADKIKNGTIQSVFGNVDMDKRTIITWSDELKQTYADALSSWDYDPEVGSIDTVFGGSNRFGEELNGVGWEVAFTPILPDGTFLSQDAVYDYINTILEEAYANDGKVTEDELVAIDAQGRQIGNTFVHGIFAGIDDSQNYDNNGNWAETVGRLMHFSGDFGAVQIAKDAIEKAKKQESDFDWDSWFKENSINTQEEIDRWNEIAESATNAADARKKYTEGEEGNETDILSFNDVFNSSDFSDTKDKLLSIAKSGELSAKTLESTEEYADLLKAVGGNAELAQSKIMDMLDSTEKLSAASDGIGSLEDAYNEMKDDGFVLAKTLESLPDVFKDLQGFKSFSEIVGNPQNTADEMQQAFNDIASEYLVTQGTLSGLVNASESEIQTYIANLKAMGITNAEEVVSQTTSALQETESLISDAETEFNVLYDNGKKEYIDYINSKAELDANYLSNVAANNSGLIAALGSTYQSDYQNWTNLLTKKAEAYNEFVDAIGGSYDSSKTWGDNLVANKIKKGEKITITDVTNAAAAAGQYEKLQYESEKAKQQVQIDLTKIKTNFGGGGLSYSAPKGSGSKGGGDGSSKEFSEDIDWIETKISRLEREITNLGKIADATWKTWTDRNKALAGEISKTTDEIKVQQQVYDRYMKAANDVGLDETYAKKVREGAIEIETITDEDLNNKISQYKDFYEKALDCKDAIADLQNQLADFVQTKFDDITKELEQLNAQIEHSMDLVNKKQDLREAWGLQTDPKRYADNNNYIKQQQKLLEQERKNLQDVMKDALSKGIDINSEQYRDMLAQMNDLESQMKENEVTMAENTVAMYTTAFDNITENYDYLVDKINHQINMMDKQMSLLEAKGRMGSMSYYEGNNNYLKKQQELITKEQLELQKVMKNALAGGLSVDSKQYKEWESQMNSLEEQLLENEVSIAENTKAMRELNEQYFEYQQELIQDVMDEVSFVGDVLSHKKLINDDGTFTSEGKASLGTSAINYDFAMAMADEYGKMVTAYEMLAEKDPNNTEIANKLSEYRKAQQDSINSALGYYEDMKSMVKDAFDQMIDNLNNIADKYIEGLNLQKDMYDYEKSIREKTDNISDLRRQIAAYSGDSSEETRGTLQTLYNQLQTAEEDLQETEYQRWLTDQQSMIDNMMQDAQEWEQAYLDSFEEYLDYWMDFINQNQLEIGDSIQEVLGEVGYLNNVSDSMNAILESIQSGETIVSSYDSKVYGELSGFAVDALKQAGIVTRAIDNNGIRLDSIGSIIEKINTAVQQLASKSDEDDEDGGFSFPNTSYNPGISNTSNNSNNTNNKPTPNPPVNNNSNNKPAPTPPSSQGNGQANVGDKVTLVSGKVYNTSGGGSPTGNSKGQYNGSQVYITKIAPGAKYPYHISTGNRLGSGDLGWISLDKLKGYATGGRNIMDDFIWTQEGGKGEIVRTSDGALLTPIGGKGGMVFNNAQSEALWNLTKSLVNQPSLPTINPSSVVTNARRGGDIHLSFEGGISMYGVNDPETFAKNLADSLNNNTRIKKIIQDNTLGVALGKNSLNGLRH